MGKIEETIARIQPLDAQAMAAAAERQNNLTKPLGSLGRLEELSIRVAGIQGKARPVIENKVIVTMAGDHGVCAEGVSAYPPAVTPQMVFNFLRGGAAINALSRHVGARMVIVDVGVAEPMPEHPGLLNRNVARGTANMAQGPAMTREQAIQALEVGIEVVERELARGLDIVGTGDMGIGNTTPSSAIVSAITGEPAALLTGRGTGLNDEQLRHKIAVIERSLAVNRPDPKDGLDVLAKVGGLEIAGLAGVMLGAAAHRVVVVVDGFISGAAALIAYAICPTARDYMVAAHLSVEIGHQAVMRHLGLTPLVDLGLRLGEGTGAALGISLVEASVRVLNEMATFAEAGVAEKDSAESGAS
ncbi:MAG: nicotinate-nucleotide--dimethylbenzimidazole phosphoribosyltransferase [Chloroflexota bacterium]